MRSLQITRKSPDHDGLIDLYKKEENPRLKERYQALYLLCEGNNCTKVAKIIKRSRRTILNWLHELGFTLQRPRYRFKKADPKQQVKFIQEFQKKWVLSNLKM